MLLIITMEIIIFRKRVMKQMMWTIAILVINIGIQLNLKSKLRDGDFHLKEFDNQKLALTNIVNNQLKKYIYILMKMIDCLIQRNPLKICQMLTIKYIGSQIIVNPKQRLNMNTKKSCQHIKWNWNISKLTKKYQP